MRQYAYQELTHTAYGKAEEGKGEQKQMVQLSALLLKGETNCKEGNATRAFPPVPYERAKPIVEREPSEGTQKRYEHFRRSLKRRRKRSKQDARNMRPKGEEARG